MKFNLNSLKNMFSALRKSPIDDIAINAVKNNADDVARLAANSMPSTGSTLQKVLLNADDIVDDIPTHISIDDMLDWRNNPIDPSKAPITPYEFTSNYNLKRFGDARPFDVNAGDPPPLKLDSTPDYSALDIRPERFGQRRDLIDSLDYPDGFTNPDDFARYYDSLELGYIPKEFTFPSFIPSQEKLLKGQNAYYAGNILSMQDALNLPVSSKTLEKSQALAKKYIHPDERQFYYPLSKNRMTELYKKLLNSNYPPPQHLPKNYENPFKSFPKQLSDYTYDSDITYFR